MAGSRMEEKMKYVIVDRGDFIREPLQAHIEKNCIPSGMWQATRELAEYIPIRCSEIEAAKTATDAELKELTLEHREVLIGLFIGRYDDRCGGIILRQGEGSNLPTWW